MNKRIEAIEESVDMFREELEMQISGSMASQREELQMMVKEWVESYVERVLLEPGFREAGM
jgi:hypothetical protein